MPSSPFSVRPRITLSPFFRLRFSTTSSSPLSPEDDTGVHSAFSGKGPGSVYLKILRIHGSAVVVFRGNAVDGYFFRMRHPARWQIRDLKNRVLCNVVIQTYKFPLSLIFLIFFRSGGKHILRRYRFPPPGSDRSFPEEYSEYHR